MMLATFGILAILDVEKKDWIFRFMYKLTVTVNLNVVSKVKCG